MPSRGLSRASNAGLVLIPPARSRSHRPSRAYLAPIAAARREPQHRVFGEQPLVRREAAEAHALVRVVERQLELAPAARVAAALRLGREPQPHLPQQLAACEPKAVAPSHPHQVLDRGAFELGRCAPHHVADAPERAAPRAFRHGRGRRLFAPIPDEREAYPHGTSSLSPFPGLPPAAFLVFNCAPHVAHVHVRQPDLDPVPLGVPPQRVERIEPHRLVVEQPAVILGRWGSIRSTRWGGTPRDRKSTRLNSSHGYISYAVFCLKKKKK